MTRIQKTISISIGSFMLLGGLNKFREPFITMFHQQITLSGLPFPELAKLAGEFGEIFAGLTLLVLVFLWNRFPQALAKKSFVFANLLIVFIMSVAVYVHLHPAVPAEILPFGYKPPLSTVITMVLALLNIALLSIAEVQGSSRAILNGLTR